MTDPRQRRTISITGLVWAVSSACAPMPPAKRADPENAHSFAVSHHEQLEQEIGGGGGPHVRTLATLAKCPNIIDTARALTAQKTAIYPAPNAEIAADRLVSVLAGDPGLHCSAVGASSDDGDPNALQKHGEGRAKTAADRANMKEQYGEQ